MKKFLAVVPARIGSKRCAKKNFREFDGHEPLYLKALKQALGIDRIKKVVLSTDEKRENLKLPDGVVFDQRPTALAGDDATSQEVAMELWWRHCDDLDGLIWLQPTSPFRSDFDIQQSMELYNGIQPIISICEHNGKHPCSIDEKGRVVEYKENLKKFTVNGAIYILPIYRIFSKKWIENAQSFIMSRNRSMDIDTEEDFLNARRCFDERYY